jgi:prepilin-type N-terminal cleavage/methylation domain-containing protein
MTGLANFEKVKGVTKMKKKGFTLVELLVVIAIIALLMGILMPALARVRQIAYRMICGTHLKGIGSSMMIYANDNKEEYPIAGTTGSVWSVNGKIEKFDAINDSTDPAFTVGEATITSCLFMLVKNYDVTASMFNCKGDTGIKEFKLSDTGSTVRELALVWDFGMGNGTTYPKPGQYNSYAYHNPYKNASVSTPGDAAFPINAVSPPGSPVCADRNPYLDKNAYHGYLDASASGTSEIAATWDSTKSEYTDRDKTGNCSAHQREGQNVLYNDNHANFEKFPNVGVQNDNIWKHWPPVNPNVRPIESTAQMGGTTSSSTYSPSGKNGGDKNKPRAEMDAYLVSEHNSSTNDCP